MANLIWDYRGQIYLYVKRGFEHNHSNPFDMRKAAFNVLYVPFWLDYE